MANVPTPNENYDVVSVLYHLLQSADTLEKYCQDAEQSKDKELTSFFKEVQKSNTQLAKKAQTILKTRLQ